jgi:hypothetical protein
MKTKEAIEQARNNDDLWQQLDEALKDVEPPSDSFTLEEFMKRRNLSRGKAQRQIRHLKEIGKVKMLGRYGNHFHYQLVK